MIWAYDPYSRYDRIPAGVLGVTLVLIVRIALPIRWRAFDESLPPDDFSRRS
jgi:hypothetical protein